MKDSNTLAMPDNATGQSSLASSPRYLTKKDLAKLVQLSVRSIDNLLREGCPHLKLGRRRVRFDEIETRRWLADKFRVQRRGTA
jgi:predicted DNA-binding transcriptional regulator AlpA